MTGIIIQARMGSTRLPGKILKPLVNKNILEHIFYRLSFLQHEVKVILATSDSSKDDVVEGFCKTKNVDCFRGSENNVLERYYLCAKKNGFQNVIRLTGDNPFTDIEELDNLISFFENKKLDFANSFSVMPVGVGAEIFTFKALEDSYINGKLPHHLEHVDEYLIENPRLFKTGILHVPITKNFPKVRLTIDTPEDFRKAELILKHAKSEFVKTEEAIQLCLQFA